MMDAMDMRVTIGGVTMQNPVTTASGTFGSGREYSQFVDLNRLGAITVKGVSDKPWPGNPAPRVAETYSGMLNAVGLQNPGMEAFIADDIPFLRRYDTKIIVNICGHTPQEYCNVVERLATEDIDLLELNISCPNVSEGGITFGTNWKMVEQVVGDVKKRAKQPLIVKLTPNVTDIDVIARAAESAGADALSMINTLLGMKIDIHKRKPLLGNKTGGLSGPAVKPVAVRMIYQVAQSVKIPIIGMGGIANGDDAIEFILAGASMVAVGTANFANPYATTDTIDGIAAYMEKYNVRSVQELVGAAWK